jgi:hypothetical protein
VINTLYESEFIQTLGNYGAQILKDAANAPSLRRQTGVSLKRPLRADEEYARRAFISAGELLTVCHQMVYAAEFLSGFRKRRLASGDLVTRLDHVVYHLENHFIRAGMITDRALQLVNIVFRLGVPERECRFAVVVMNEHVSHTKVTHCLKELERVLKPYRAPRNIIIHLQRYTDKTIEKIEPFYILEKAGLDKEESDITTELTKLYPLVKSLTDEEVRSRKAELSKCNQTVFKEVSKLFTELLPVFNENRAKLAM